MKTKSNDVCMFVCLFSIHKILGVFLSRRPSLEKSAWRTLAAASFVFIPFYSSLLNLFLFTFSLGHLDNS